MAHLLTVVFSHFRAMETGTWQGELAYLGLLFTPVMCAGIGTSWVLNGAHISGL